MARKLKQPKEAIQDVKEKAFQRAIFHKRHIIVGKQAIEWYAMESPIDKNRESEGKARGQSNVDLIGRIEKTETFIVCEVKFSCNKKDSPQDAANEACRYYNVITKDALLLDSSSTHHQGEKDFLWSDIKHGHSELWVVANAAYWTYWLGHRRMTIPVYGFSNGLQPQKVRCFSIDVSEDFFKQKKGLLKEYIPAFEEGICWTEL